MTVQEDLLEVSGVLSEALGNLTPGTEEYTTVFNQLIKVDEKLIEMEKANIENVRREREMEEARKDRNIKLGVDIGKTVGTMAFYAGMAFVMFYWEEEKSFTGTMRNWASKFVPNKMF